MRHWLSVVATAILAFPVMATPLSATAQLPFLDVCLRAESDIDTMAEALSQFGWRTTTDANATLTRGLTWIGTTQYFTTDNGGEMVETILALKEKTAMGLLRKKDIPQSKGRFLVRGDEVLHVMWRKPTQTVTEIECHAALSADAKRAGITLDRADIDDEAASGFTQLPAQSVMGGQIHVSLLSAKKLSPHSPPHAVLRTYLRTQSQ